MVLLCDGSPHDHGSDPLSARHQSGVVLDDLLDILTTIDEHPHPHVEDGGD